MGRAGMMMTLSLRQRVFPQPLGVVVGLGKGVCDAGHMLAMSGHS
jgi:hypothetical protein